MTLEQALADIEKLGRGGLARSPVAEQEISCQRHTTGRAASRRGLRAPSEARPSVRRPAPVRLSRTAARECAARLMASGPALPVPRLAVGCLEPFLPSNTYSGAFDLARNLLLAGVGQPEDWERSKGDPVAFMLQTVERTAAAFNRKAIDAVAHTDILFGTSPYISSWHEKEYEDPNRVFLAVEATHISIIYLRPTLELLGKAHPRLPATFYRMLLEGVSSWILCYDESACEAFYEWSMESYAGGQGERRGGSGEAAEHRERKGAMAGETVQAAPVPQDRGCHRVSENWVAGAPNSRCRLPSPDSLEGS